MLEKNIQDYRSLLKDTIKYLKNSNIDIVTSIDDFYNKKIYLSKIIPPSNLSPIKNDISSFSQQNNSKSINSHLSSQTTSSSVTSKSLYLTNKPATDASPKHFLAKSDLMQNDMPKNANNNNKKTIDNNETDDIKENTINNLKTNQSSKNIASENNLINEKVSTNKIGSISIQSTTPSETSSEEPLSASIPLKLQPIVEEKVKLPLPTSFRNLNNFPVETFFDDFSDIKSSLRKASPNISLIDQPLDDAIAKQKSQKYKYKNIASPISILAYRENERFYKFLEKLAIALDVCFYPTKVVSSYLMEKQNLWNSFLTDPNIFLIISSDYTIFELKNLRKFYKEKPATSEKFINDIPLFLLPDIALYLKEPTLKLSLFKTLEKKIRSIKNG